MKFIESVKEKTRELIKGAWATLGMPFNFPVINERIEGIIDAEALIMATLLLLEKDRTLTDLPAWLRRFSCLINHQKVKTMVKTMPRQHSSRMSETLSQTPFGGAPKSMRNIFNLKEAGSEVISETILMRERKLNTIPNVARDSIMIQNRLLYGTGFRADLISLTHIKGLGMKGTRLAKLLCTNDSTVSRILKDLRACRFLDHENERIVPVESYPGMFISTQSVWNLCEVIDAFEFSFEELRRSAFEALDFTHDGFCRKVFSDWT